MATQEGPHGQFNASEDQAMGPGGSLSTPKKRKSVPADHFLMPGERKYPYMVDGKISCNLLRAAISRAGQNNEKDVEARARKMFDMHCGA